jgi:hypothetical protein
MGQSQRGVERGGFEGCGVDGNFIWIYEEKEGLPFIFKSGLIY